MFDALEPQVVVERRRMLQKYLDALVDAEHVCEDRYSSCGAARSRSSSDSYAVMCLLFWACHLET